MTLTSSLISSANAVSAGAAGCATVSDASGSRTRSCRALRRPSAALHTARVRSIVDSSDESDGQPSTDGQSHRCTLASPVSPRQIVSAVIGSSGAAARVTVSRTVHSVSSAARSPSQNRDRDRRMYQLVSSSR